jgi:hypothetical protein
LVLDWLQACLSKPGEEFHAAVMFAFVEEGFTQGLANGGGGVERVVHMDTSPGMLDQQR